jgi:hypothetical protein
MVYVPSANSGTGQFYNTQSFDHEGMLYVFTVIEMASTRMLSHTNQLTRPCLFNYSRSRSVFSSFL